MKIKIVIFNLLFVLPIFFYQTAVAQSIMFANGVGGTQPDQAMGVTSDLNGNIITTGYFTGTADFNSSANDSLITSKGSNDVFVVKTDSAGNFIWAFNIGGTLDEFNYSSAVTDDGANVYVCGVYSDNVDFDPSPLGSYVLTSIGQYDGFIAKYSSAGSFIWAKSFGGLLNDDVYHLTSAFNGGILFGGSFDTSADLNPDTSIITNYISNGGLDIFFGTIDSAGNLLWLNTIGGSSFDHINSTGIDQSGNIILQGAFTDSIDANPGAANNVIYGVNSPGFIAKYDKAGNYIWANGFNSLSPFGLATDNAGNIYSCGYINATTDLNPGIDSNKVFLIGNFDGYVAKYDSLGNYLNAFGIGSNNFDIAYDVELTNSNEIVVGGYFNNNADFNPDASLQNILSSYGMSDAFIATYDTALNYLNAFKAGSAMFDFCRNIAIDAANNLIMAGGFSATADFNPGALMQTLTSTGSRDGFIVKYGNFINGFDKSNTHSSLKATLYPNPVNDILNFKVVDYLIDGVIEIVNIEGIVLLREKLSDNSIALHVSHLERGLYFIRLTASHKNETMKFIKQ